MDKLRQAAQAGDINEMYKAIKEERHVLSRIDEAELADTPLHIAASGGHADFAKAIMYLKPSFGRKLNENIYSPMQLAMQNGHKQVVLDLLAADKDIVRVKGREGYTALHYAAEKGDVDLLARFLKDCPTCVEDVTIRNENALHLAVKNNKLEAVEILARFLHRTRLYCKVSKSHLLNSKDRNGNTALHIAASNTQPQMVQVLIECRVRIKETNKEGFTALKMLEMQSSETKNREKCLNIIRRAQKERSVPKRVLSELSAKMEKGVKRLLLDVMEKGVIVYLKNSFSKQKKLQVEPGLSERLRTKITVQEELVMPVMSKIMDMSTEKMNALLVVVTLILTATYQAVLTPPGGVWQSEYPPQSSRVGESVMDESNFNFFYVEISQVFLFSLVLTIIFLNAVSESLIVTLTVEVLLVSFTWCIWKAAHVITPRNAVIGFSKKSSNNSLAVEIQISSCVVFLFCILQVLKWYYRTSHIRFFRQFLRRDM